VLQSSLASILNDDRATSAFDLPHLHEDFADDDIIIIFEHCAEHHGHSVFLGLYVPVVAKKIFLSSTPSKK